MSSTRPDGVRLFFQRWVNRLRVGRAAVLLTIAGLAQRFVPMTRWSTVLGRAGPVPEAWSGRRIEALPSRATNVAERDVAVAIRRAARRLPWKPSCLAEATAGQILLRRAGTPGVVVIGLRPSEPGSDEQWSAHAWLLGQDGALTGGPAARGFTATTVYEVPGGLSATEIAG